MKLHGADQAFSEKVKSADFIRAMRAVASSVTVVTTNGGAGCHGATVSTFCSVSAEPPLVLVCIRKGSRIARTIGANGCFCVNVIPSTCQAVADRFAGCHDDRLSDRFDGIDCEKQGLTGPVIVGSTAFACTLEETFESGSHQIFIGRVIQVHQGLTEPLAWLNGAYHRVVPHSGNPHQTLVPGDPNDAVPAIPVVTSALR